MASVVFTDLVGSTELMARVGQEAFDDLRRDHFARLRGAVVRNGGTEVKTLGDGVLAAFDSASDAVACAIAMQQLVALQSELVRGQLAIRVGLAVGEVSFESGDVFGRPVVEAARLVALARGGQVLATQAVRLVAGDHPAASFSEMGAVQLKGLPEVVAFEVAWQPLPGCPVPLPALLTDVASIFVGRDRELGKLRRAWDETSPDATRVILLAGEPGVGKTRLVAELATQVYREGATVLAGRCDEGLGVPFELFVEPLRHFVDHMPDDELVHRLGRFSGELVRLVPELADKVPGLPPPLDADPETERYRAFDAVASWLSDLAADRPVLLVLDDLHWAAKPNLLLLRHVLRSPSLARLLVVGTYRDTELAPDHPLVELLADLRRGTAMQRIELGGLSQDGVTAYVREAAGRDLHEQDVAVARALHAETQGNPFFVREVLRHLSETGALQRRNGRWDTALPVEHLGIPEGVRDVIRRRLSRLSKRCRRLVRAAAVIGLEFDLQVLAAGVDLDGEEVLTGLEEAMTARVVVESPTRALTYRFTHALMRETIYGDLSTARRVTLHRRIAEALETAHAGDLEQHLQALAHHYGWAAVPGATNANAVSFSRRAGDQSLARLANSDAVRFYKQALDLLEASEGQDESSPRLDLLISLGEAQRRAGDPAHRDTLIAACRLARDRGDAQALATAALSNHRGMFAVIGAVDEDRAAMLEAALEAQGPAETALRARLLANLAVEVVYGKDRSRRHALSAEALAMAKRSGDQRALAHVLLARIVAIWGPDTVDERLFATEELLAVAGRLNDPVLVCSGCWHRFIAATEAGEEAEANRCLERSEQLATELGQRTMRWLTMILRASRTLWRGHIEESKEIAERAYELGGSAGHPDAYLYYGIHLFNVCFERGQMGAIASDIIRIAAANPGVTSVRASLALLYAETDQLDQARPVFESVVDELADIPREASWPRAVTQASLICSRLGDRARAATLFDLLRPYAGHMVCTGLSSAGSVEHYLGLLVATLGRLDEADGLLARAEVAHGRVPAPTWLARTRLERGRVLLERGATGDPAKAHELLSSTLATAREYGLGRIERSAADLLSQIRHP